MIKTLAFIARRPDITREAFRDHYETWHVPTALPRLPSLAKYVRNHLLAGEPGFDVITEFWFPDRAATEAVAAMLESDFGAALLEDELRFMDKPRNFSCPFDEERVSGPERDVEVGPASKFIVLARSGEPASADTLRSALAAELCEAPSVLRCITHEPSSFSADPLAWDAAVMLWLTADARPPTPRTPGAERLVVLPVVESETPGLTLSPLRTP